MKFTARWTLVLFSAMILAAMLFAACEQGEKPASDIRSGDEAAETSVPDLPRMKDGVILPDEPLWPEGTRMSPEVRDEVILRRSHGLDQLYRQAMETHGDTLQGNLTLRFLVYPDGTVGPPEIKESSWNVPEAQYLTEEMASLVARWTFPTGEKTVAITQPWRFEP